MFILNTNFPSSKPFLLYIEIQDPVIDMLVEISNIYSCISIIRYLIDILQYVYKIQLHKYVGIVKNISA